MIWPSWRKRPADALYKGATPGQGGEGKKRRGEEVDMKLNFPTEILDKLFSLKENGTRKWPDWE